MPKKRTLIDLVHKYLPVLTDLIKFVSVVVELVDKVVNYDGSISELRISLRVARKANLCT